jgi:succinate dehydrogenase / fumarate reductase flavoprotein subunit
MWDNCGMARNASGLSRAIGEIQALREEFWQNVNVLGDNQGMNPSLEHAGRLADFLELGELMCRDALHREESCGGHFREEHQTEEGEALRDDDQFSYVAAWEWTGPGSQPALHKEPLTSGGSAIPPIRARWSATTPRQTSTCRSSKCSTI